MENLSELMEEIKSKFKVKKKRRMDVIAFSLRYWQRGYWSIEVVDDWHKWSEKGIEMPRLMYATPEIACKEFLKFIKENKINIKKLQSED